MNTTPRFAGGCLIATLFAASCSQPRPPQGPVSSAADSNPQASAPGTSRTTTQVQFPAALHGFWVSVDQACTDDTEAAMRITAEELVGYEEIRRPVRVETRPGVVPAWTIGTEVDTGPDGEFTTSVPVEFALEGDELVSDYKPFADRYRRCDARSP